MANTLQKQAAPKENLVEYLANGETVRLSPNMIKQYLVNGGGNVTNEEIMMFLNLCRFQHLNPFIREAYLIKYGSQPATMVVGKDTFMKRANERKEFQGFTAGIIVRDAETGEIQEREGTFYAKDTEHLLGGWCKVFLDGWRVPVYASVPLDEYIGRKKDGEINGQWASKPATMIRKVALVQALREAFPDTNSGLYTQEEVPEIADVILPETAVTAIEEKPEAPAEDEKPKQEASAAAALFGR